MLFHNPMMYRPRHRSGGPGCFFFVFCFLALVVVGGYSIRTGTVAMLLQNKSMISIPLSVLHGVAQAQQPPPSYTVTGKPSLSAAFVNQVLAQAHSPAAGTGQALYDLSLKYDIDDAYALAFFEHESSFGTTGLARMTRSLGNIRCSAGSSCLEGFRAYPTWQAGDADWYSLMRTLYVAHWHLLTLPQIVPVYAPASDGNDVAAYIAAVERDVTTWRAGKTTP